MHPVYVFCNYALYNIWPIFPGHKTCILCQTLIVPNSKAMFNSHVLNVGNRNVHPSFSFQCMGDRLLGFWENEWKVKIILLYFSQNRDFVLNFVPPYIYSEFIRSHLVLHKTWRLIKGNLLWNNVKYRLGHISSKLHRGLYSKLLFMILCKTLRISVFLPCCSYLKCTILAKPTLKTFIIFAEDPWQYINIAEMAQKLAPAKKK